MWLQHFEQNSCHSSLRDIRVSKLSVSTESEEVTPGIVLDFDERNQVIGIEIEDASTFIDLSRLEVSALPISNLILNKGVPVEA